MPSSPTSRSHHSLDTMPGDAGEQASSTTFPRYHDDETASSEEDTIAADEAALFLRPGDEEIDSSSDVGSDIPPDRLKHSWLRHIHPRIRKSAIWVARWTKGPDPPRIYKIRPVFSIVQEAPVKLLDRYLPRRKHKIILLIAFYFVWFLTFSLVLKRSAFSADVPGYGAPVRLSCASSYW